jgi:hypothetical protein
MHESMREKNKLQYKKEYERHKEEAGQIEQDVGFLDKIEDNFDPIQAYFKAGNKRQRTQ